MIDRENIIKKASKLEDKLVLSRVIDKINLCEKSGEIVHTEFLDPYQRRLIEGSIKSIKNINYIFSGGFNGAERVVLFFCPDFISIEDLDLELYFSVLDIKSNSREKLSHRDYLGSILGLGIRREKIGDIILGENICQVVVTREIADFLLYNLSKVGNSKVSLETRELSNIGTSETDITEVNRVVASLRLDSVVSAGFGMSRGKAQEIIKAEKVYINWEQAKDSSKLLKQGDTITLRGKGRIVLEKVGGLTKKDRIGIVIKKYM